MKIDEETGGIDVEVENLHNIRLVIIFLQAVLSG
jgi:hypothetical protein